MTMLEFLTYDAKVAVLIGVFYLFYRLLLANETFHRVNRAVLLSATVLSFVLPLCVITLHETVVVPMPTVEVGGVRAVVADDEPAVPVWQVLLPAIYIIGVAATLGYMLLAVVKILLLVRRSEKHRQPDGIMLCVADGDVSPFSWMHYIVMSRRDYAEHDPAVLAHERAHIRLHHSWDVLFVDILTALQWPNPAMWMLRQDLRAIHEYEADGEVLSQGFNARQYQYLLITKATGIGGYSIANGISHSTLKKRIHMMLHKKSSGSHLLKLFALVPIVGMALALNAETVTDVVCQQPQKKQIIKKGKKNATVKTAGANEVVVVEQGQPEAETSKLHTLKGQVYSPDDMQPVVGAVVRIAGSKKGAVTDQEGRFTLDAQEDDMLEVMYVGMQTTTMPAKSCISYMTTTGQECLIPMFKEKDAEAERVFDVVEEMPEFPGGPSAMMMYLAENIRYPEGAYENNAQGRVIVNFVIEKDGSVTEPNVVSSVEPLLDAEAVRVVSSMPKWTPGKQNGKAVRVKYTIPITFKVQGGHADKDFDVEVDGKPANIVTLKGINPADIESMKVEKAKDGMPHDRIIVKLKKKQE